MKHKILHGDVLTCLASLGDNSIDLCIADPPYNIISNNRVELPKNHEMKNMGGAWSIFGEKWDRLELGDYLKFTIDYLNEVKRVVKPTGSIWIFGTYHNIGLVNTSLRLLDVEIINEVIWYKKNASEFSKQTFDSLT